MIKVNIKILNILMIVLVLFFNSCNIDNEDEKAPEIKVYINDQVIDNGGNLYIPDQVINYTHNNTIKVKNIGDKTLEISSIVCDNTTGDSFWFINDYNISVSGGNEETFGVALYATITSFFECEITINSNASNIPSFIFTIQASTENP